MSYKPDDLLTDEVWNIVPNEVSAGNGKFFFIESDGDMIMPIPSKVLYWSPDNGTPVMVELVRFLSPISPQFFTPDQTNAFIKIKALCKKFPSVNRCAMVKDCLKA